MAGWASLGGCPGPWVADMERNQGQPPPVTRHGCAARLIGQGRWPGHSVGRNRQFLFPILTTPSVPVFQATGPCASAHHGSFPFLQTPSSWRTGYVGCRGAGLRAVTPRSQQLLQPAWPAAPLLACHRSSACRQARPLLCTPRRGLTKSATFAMQRAASGPIWCAVVLVCKLQSACSRSRVQLCIPQATWQLLQLGGCRLPMPRWVVFAVGVA